MAAVPLLATSASGRLYAQEGLADSRLAAVVARALESPELPALAAGLIDTIGGRLSGTADGVRAEAWAVRWLRDFGFDSVWSEVVPMPVWRRGEIRVDVMAPAPLRHRPLRAVAYGYSPGIAADSIPVLDIGRGDPAAIREAGRRLRGIALLADVASAEAVAAAAEVGAAAFLRISIEPGRLPQTRLAPWEDPPAPLPVLGLAYEDGRWLRRQLATGSVALGLSVVAETSAGSAANVVAEWKGSDPRVSDEVFLLGAHLDAWDLGDGAVDNGTGVLAVMAAARALAAAESRPRRTVRIVLFAGEELGLWGSRTYVRDHAAEVVNIVAMMNLDMVGAALGYGATGHSEADTLFAELVQEPRLRDLGLTAEVDHAGGLGTDNQPFVLAGVPTIYVRSSLPPEVLRWYHNAGDTLDKIDLDSVRSTAAAAAAAAWTLADHPGRPLRHLSPEETRQLLRHLGVIK